MTLVSEAIARYHKLIESEPYIDLAWAHALQERIKSEKLDGRPVSPVLRPVEVVLYGISGLDPISYMGAMAILLSILTAAALLPVRRAFQLDIARILHFE